MKLPVLDAQQDELALSALATHAIYPGRRTITVAEFARDFCITGQQVIDLIICGDLLAVRISASRGLPEDSAAMSKAERSRVPRAHWRIPVSAYDAFVTARKSR